MQSDARQTVEALDKSFEQGRDPICAVHWGDCRPRSGCLCVPLQACLLPQKAPVSAVSKGLLKCAVLQAPELLQFYAVLMVSPGFIMLEQMPDLQT